MKRHLISRPRTSTCDLSGCSEKELDRHVRDVLHEAGNDGLTMDEVYEGISCRTRKQLVGAMVREGELVQVAYGTCYLTSSRTLAGNNACSNPDCQALANEP